MIEYGMRLCAGSDRESWPFEEGVSAFFGCFGVLGERLSDLYWCNWNFISGPYSIFAEDEFDTTWLEGLIVEDIQQYREESGCPVALFRPGFLPSLAQHIYADDCEIFGLCGGEQEAIQFVRCLIDIRDRSHVVLESVASGTGSFSSLASELSELRRQIIRDKVSCYFRNHDAAYWDYFADSEESLSIVMQAARKTNGIQISDVELKDPDWDLDSEYTFGIRRGDS